MTVSILIEKQQAEMLEDEMVGDIRVTQLRGHFPANGILLFLTSGRKNIISLGSIQQCHKAFEFKVNLCSFYILTPSCRHIELTHNNSLIFQLEYFQVWQKYILQSANTNQGKLYKHCSILLHCADCETQLSFPICLLTGACITCTGR